MNPRRSILLGTGACVLIGATLTGVLMSIGTAQTVRPALTSSIVSAVNNTDMTITPAAAGQTAMISEATAQATALNQLPPGSAVLGASLVMLTDGLFPAGRLVWAVSVNPAGPHFVAGGVGTSMPPEINFRVDFVDATTGQWLQADMGRDPNLPALPVLPVSSTGAAATTVPGSQFGGIKR
jgi:hypothetical protein